MNRISAALLSIFLVLPLAAQQQQPPPTQQQQGEYPREQRVTVDPRPGTDDGSQLKFVDYFRGRATFRGRPPADVTIRQWSIAGAVRVTRFPEEGFLVIELRGGQLITTINGERREREDGEIWTVPAGAAMTVETGRDMAILEVLAVKE